MCGLDTFIIIELS